MRLGFRDWLFRTWYWYISSVDTDAEVLFMNYGYECPDLELDLDPADEPHRYSIQLYYHLAATLDLAGKDLLEIGSGRGGGLSFLARRLRPGSALGVELNARAVQFCNTRYDGIEGLRFVQGDAQALNLPAASFDAVINVESSHRYPDMVAFLGEVERVLRPGGHFLFTDFRWDHEMEELRSMLADSGLTLVGENIITPKVVRALDLDDARRRRLVARLVPGFLHQAALDFAAAKDSKTFASFVNGDHEYFSFILRKASA